MACYFICKFILTPFPKNTSEGAASEVAVLKFLPTFGKCLLSSSCREGATKNVSREKDPLWHINFKKNNQNFLQSPN